MFGNVQATIEHQNLMKNWLSNPKDILLMIGSPGTGKTTFCSAVIDWMFGKVPSIRYWNERDIYERLRAMIGSSQGGDYIKELSYILDDYLVIIDDMGSAGFNDWRREVWLEIIDSRYNSNLPTIITSNLTMAQIRDQMGERSYSRLMDKGNKIITMHGHDDLRQQENLHG